VGRALAAGADADVGTPALRALYAHPYKMIHSSAGDTALFNVVLDTAEEEDLSGIDLKPLSRLLKLLGQFTLAHPPLYGEDPAGDANLWPRTDEALQALGYVE
jgi:hypothetical protein